MNRYKGVMSKCCNHEIKVAGRTTKYYVCK